MSTIVWFEGYWPGLKDQVGGKGASLGEILGAGIPVPPGFVLTTNAYRAAAKGIDFTRDLAHIQAALQSVTMPAAVETELRNAYAELAHRSNLENLPVAVRSSATREDSSTASFAGEYDTYLWVRGADAVVEAVRQCWASLFNERAVSYREELALGHDVEMAVVVQRMVIPRSAGVAFTLNPADGDRSVIAIDSAWGFGEAIVAGEVTPDHFVVDKVLLEITKRTVSAKECEYVITAGERVERVPLTQPRSSMASLNDDEVRSIAKMAKSAERHYGSPQDIEWAIDHDGSVVALQSRPETVWSRLEPPSVTTEAGPVDLMASIVATLANPIPERREGGTS